MNRQEEIIKAPFNGAAVGSEKPSIINVVAFDQAGQELVVSPVSVSPAAADYLNRHSGLAGMALDPEKLAEKGVPVNPGEKYYDLPHFSDVVMSALNKELTYVDALNAQIRDEIFAESKPGIVPYDLDLSETGAISHAVKAADASLSISVEESSGLGNDMREYEGITAPLLGLGRVAEQVSEISFEYGALAPGIESVSYDFKELGHDQTPGLAIPPPAKIM